jgi:hypothetical protein
MKKHQQLLVWASLCGLLFLFALALLIPPSPPSPYERIQNGMSMSEVQELLGPSAAQSYTDLKSRAVPPLASPCLTAEQWDDGAFVTYDEQTGLVSGKSLKPRNPVARMLVRLRELSRR